MELLDDKKYLGALCGIIASLHSWSQTLILHPHIHCLITGGGLGLDGQWYQVSNGYLLPSRVVMAKFRGKLLDYIDREVAKNKLKLPEGMGLQQWKNLKNKLGRVKWNVCIRERYEHGNGVLSYLARYIRGGPISNKRIISCDGKKVTFRYRVNGEDSGSKKTDTMSIPIDRFIRRYLLHVPAPGRKIVRYYGLYNPGKKAELGKCMEEIAQVPVEEPEFLDWQTYCESRGDHHPEQCPICGKRLICLSVIPRARSNISSEEAPFQEAA